MRRLKIEYESFFAGGSPRPPSDSVFRVETTIKKYNSALGELNFAQRFRFNQLAQRYAVYNDLWRKKLREREEGRAASSPASNAESETTSSPFRVVCSDPENERDNLAALLKPTCSRGARLARAATVSISSYSPGSSATRRARSKSLWAATRCNSRCASRQAK